MRKRAIYFMIMIGVFLSLVSCSGDDPVSSIAGDTRITGQVRAYICEINDDSYYYYGENYYKTYYSLVTGREATVKFIDPGEGVYTVETDDSSRFMAMLDSGTYNIVVEIWHAWPDTFYYVSIPGDTFMDLQILYDYLSLGSLDLYFRYEPASDSLGEYMERYYLDRLSLKTGNLLYVDRAIKTPGISNRPEYWYHYYKVPVDPSRPLWMIYDEIKQELDDPMNGFPEEMRLSYLGYYCFN